MRPGKRILPDYAILIAALFLTGLGLLILFSSSAVSASNLTGDSYYFFKRQLLWIVPALILFGIGLFVPYTFWKKIIFLLVGVTILFLLLTYIPALGVEAYGASRWLKIGPFSFQPSEFAKLCIILYLSGLLAHKPLTDWKLPDILRTVIPVLLVLLLIYRQPDLGTTIIIGAITMVLFYLAGLNPRIIGIFLLSTSLFILVTSWLTPYKQRRLTAFLNPWADPQDTGYHIIQSLLALGSGGLWGKAWARGSRNYFICPPSIPTLSLPYWGKSLGSLELFLSLLFFFLSLIVDF